MTAVSLVDCMILVQVITDMKQFKKILFFRISTLLHHYMSLTSPYLLELQGPLISPSLTTVLQSMTMRASVCTLGCMNLMVEWITAMITKFILTTMMVNIN